MKTVSSWSASLARTTPATVKVRSPIVTVSPSALNPSPNSSAAALRPSTATSSREGNSPSRKVQPYTAASAGSVPRTWPKNWRCGAFTQARVRTPPATN